MCAQCMATAAAATGVLSGVRAWLAAHGFAWLTPVRLKCAILGLGVLKVALHKAKGTPLP